VAADDLYLNIHGVSKHVDTTQTFNEKNQGIGLTWGDRWYSTLGGYHNSTARTSLYVGAGYSRPVIHFSNFEVTAGGVATIVSGYNVSVGFVGMATLAVGTPEARILLGYVPAYRPKDPEGWPAILTASLQIWIF
jgi:energy-converting hydrogenase Eha subunit E